MRFLLYCHVTYTSILLKETIGAVLVNLELLLFPCLENSEEACHLEDHALVSKKKGQVELAVGSPAYTSSDESDFSDDENGESRLCRYLIKKLPWERSTLTKVKRELDEAYIRSLNPRARVNLVTRRVHPRPSTRSPPTEALEWAVRVEEPTTSPSARPSSSARTPTPSPHTRHPESTTPSRSTHPPMMVTATGSTHPPTAFAPTIRTRPPSTSPSTCGSPAIRPSSTSSHPTRTETTSPSTITCPPTTVTPSPSTLPSRSGTPSLLPCGSSTPRTSKQKKNLKSKRDNACRHSSSPVF